jgi:hypothetical protein
MALRAWVDFQCDRCELVVPVAGSIGNPPPAGWLEPVIRVEGVRELPYSCEVRLTICASCAPLMTIADAYERARVLAIPKVDAVRRQFQDS